MRCRPFVITHISGPDVFILKVMLLTGKQYPIIWIYTNQLSKFVTVLMTRESKYLLSLVQSA